LISRFTRRARNSGAWRIVGKLPDRAPIIESRSESQSVLLLSIVPVILEIIVQFQYALSTPWGMAGRKFATSKIRRFAPIQMTLPSAMKKVVVLALPGARELDLASVLDVFTQANWQLAPNPAYEIQVVTSDAKGRVTGMTGLQLVENAPYSACTGEIDTLLVAGGVSLVRSDPEEPSRGPRRRSHRYTAIPRAYPANKPFMVRFGATTRT
jgi:hypothetical protein